MSYQVLARKWRPQNFHETVGQRHVMAALSHALANGRLHHAYLFTGTRGVGKTSLARILAKCMSCEQGVTDKPCGQCEACQEIAAGRFVDLIEIDAASRTKVEDTRELLDNVQYAPTKGRYKIYLIDEVHMLSTHSFNALLKTLEEPPEHVKFLLCTTDPQKLPITVISRCLQLVLKPLQDAEIIQQLTKILHAEAVPFEEQALPLIAHKAQGSMRDALSLLDQSIALSGGHVQAEQVRAMLGVADQKALLDLLKALLAHDTPQALELLEQNLAGGCSSASLLEGLATALIELTHSQCDPNWCSSYFPQGVLAELLAVSTPEQIQVWYQIVILGNRELPLAPTEQLGLEMILFRLLAFQPSRGEAMVTFKSQKEQAVQPQSPALPPKPLVKPVPEKQEEDTPPFEIDNAPSSVPAPSTQPTMAEQQPMPSAQPEPQGEAPVSIPSDVVGQWCEWVKCLPLTGMVKQLAMHCQATSFEHNKLVLELGNQHASLLNDRLHKQFEDGVKAQLGASVTLDICLQQEGVAQASPAAKAAEEKAAQEKQLKNQMHSDETVQFIKENFDGTVLDDTIQSTS